MKEEDTIVNRVVARINSEIGDDFKKLYRASVLVDHYKDRMGGMAEKLNYEDHKNTSIFKSAFQTQERASESIEFQIVKLEQFGIKLTAKIAESTVALKETQPDLELVRKLQKLLHYLKIVQEIQEISNSLTAAFNGKDEAKMVNIYLALHEDNDYENCITGRLSRIEAPFLKSFAIRSACYWHTMLTQKFAAEFEAMLKSMRWGEKDDGHSSPPRDTAKIQLLAEFLFLIKSPIEDEAELEIITPSIICHQVSIVTKLLVAPYRARFIYHFRSARQTNRLDKPEWFFTQILNWGKDVHLYVGQTFQSAAVRAGKLEFNLRLEFMRSLVQLTIEKLAEDIEELSCDENLFAHLIDETLAFESELRENFGYPASFPSAISVLTQPYYLLKWISLEKRFCADKMDLILQSDNPWLLINPNLFDDELKIPKCADQFVRLLEAIKDRYYSLIQPGHQLQFLHLQLELIDNFRRRLVQLHSSGMVGSIPILNAINYVTMVLREWGENVHYLHLHATLVGPNATEISSVFEGSVSELEHWTQELLKNLATKTVNEIKAKSMSYRHNCWATMPEQHAKEPFILSPSAGEMFQVMVTLLHNFERELSANNFKSVLRQIAKQIDNFLLDSLIMNTKFSNAGAKQLNYDITRNLFPLFGQYNSRPELLFKKVHDANKLLNAGRGVALLLHESLLRDSQEDKLNALTELGLIIFKPKMCIEVLERRMDIRL